MQTLPAPAGPGVSPDPPATAVVDSVLVALMAIGRLMRQRVDGDRLDPATFWLLKSLSSDGPMRVTELAASSNLDTSTVSRHVGQLDRAGLIERSPDPADGRAHLVGLSKAGRDLLEDASHRRRVLLTRGLRGWAPDDITQLDQLLGRFVRDVENINPNLENA